jgi:hypothetical protein
MNLAKWLYLGGRPNWVTTLLNRCWAAVHALGVAPNYLVTLEVRGGDPGAGSVYRSSWLSSTVSATCR